MEIDISMKILWGRVLLLSVAVGLAVASVRGCVMARRGEAGVSMPVAADDPIPIRVYDTRAEETVTRTLEEYLVGVVAGEMPASFPLEALKAQAVAARTYTLYHALHGGCAAHDAMVCTSSACCQAYADETRLRERWGKDYKENLRKITQAVQETAGEVLLYDGEPIEALYHSASGGGTENAEDVYKSARAYLRAVQSSAEAGTARIVGEKTFTAEEFIACIEKKRPGAKLTKSGLAGQLEILSKSESGRVLRMRVGSAEMTGRELRGALSLDSALFTFRVSGGQVTVYTRGYGHGVGMSQTGANVMALGGRTYDEILLYYYTGVTLGYAVLD